MPFASVVTVFVSNGVDDPASPFVAAAHNCTVAPDIGC
jgi:hypothetical protein